MKVLYYQKIFLIIKKVKLIGKKEFAIAIFDPNHKTFIIHIFALNISYDIGDKVHLSWKA